MIKKELHIAYQEYSSTEEFPAQEQQLIEQALEALDDSYSPYSEFKVGAAVLLNNGEIIRGSNQENAAYPSGLCAERVALFYANSRYPKEPVAALAVAAANKNGLLPLPVPPCGSCRQVLLESENRFKQDIRIILIGSEKILVFNSSADLLPLHFNHKFLNH